MLVPEILVRQRHYRNALIFSFITMLLTLGADDGQRVKTLQIGTSGSLIAPDDSGTEKGALDALASLMKDETGFDVKIVRQKGWRELADNMAKGQLQLGIFRGVELAWATDNNPHLQPLVLAGKSSAYSIVSAMTRNDNPAKDFAGLQGQSLSIPAIGDRDLRLFIDRTCRAMSKDPESFFSKITSPHNVEDALDDVVDGVVQATVVDQMMLEAYQRRKPGRFARLKEIARSKPLPPTVLAYDDRTLDEALARRIRDGLLNPADRTKQERTLSLFHWAGFYPVPTGFAEMLAQTRKTYPPPPSYR
jgi:ABC-type phosphate/phosphonate transport system substrate-binding protein